MKMYTAKKLRSGDLPGLMEYAGRECILVMFNDGCYSARMPPFISQLENTLPIGKHVVHLNGCLLYGDADYLAGLEWRCLNPDPSTGAIVLDHFRMLQDDPESSEEILFLKNHFDAIAQYTTVLIIILYRYTLNK